MVKTSKDYNMVTDVLLRNYIKTLDHSAASVSLLTSLLDTLGSNLVMEVRH